MHRMDGPAGVKRFSCDRVVRGITPGGFFIDVELINQTAIAALRHLTRVATVVSVPQHNCFTVILQPM